jgi:two-component system sensor histidine kinase RpfC
LGKLTQLFQQAKAAKSQEFSQSLVRLSLVVLVSIYLEIYYALFPEKTVMMPFIWAVTVYFIYCVILVLHILLYIKFNPVRHYFTIVFDMSLLGFGMYTGDVLSAFFYGAYFWLILGNGLRFGQRSLHLSTLLAAISFATVISITDFWQQHIELGVGLMIWLFLLPPYIGKLIIAKERALEHALLADNAKSRFLANMSHELRTPLNGIIGYSQMIHEEDIDIEEAKYASEKIDKAANHLLALISELLDMASIESGKMKIKKEAVELVSLIDEVISLVEATASKKHITIEVKANGQQIIMSDRLRLKQVLVNLLSNAIKYNHEDGQVRIETSLEKDNIVIGICDDGPGLSKEEQKKVFEPFERLSADSAKVEGAGIGLMITRSLVNMMGGEIGVDSEIDKGSCFWIKLPLARKKLKLA